MRSWRILIIAIVILACKSSVPKEILPPNKMKAVLWDIMQADEMAEYYSVKDSAFLSLSKHEEYYQKIFSIHKIDKKDFTKSLAYYENHPVVFKTVLESLKNFAERMQKADSLHKSKMPVVDSAAKTPSLQKKIPSFKKPSLPRKHH
jgi:hypothetical protein